MDGLPKRGRRGSTRVSAILRFRDHHGERDGASTATMATLLPTPSRHRELYSHTRPHPGSHRGPAGHIEQKRRHRHQHPRAALPVDLELETYLGIDWTEVKTTEELLEARTNQILRRDHILEEAHRKLMQVREGSIKYEKITQPWRYGINI